MIFDVARHRFSEGFLTLSFFAVMAMVVAFSADAVVPTEGGAPLQGFIETFAMEYPILSAVAMVVLVGYSGLRFSRAAVRVGIYSASSMAPVALAGIAMFACTSISNYLVTMAVVWLVSEVFGRLLYCFGANMRIGSLFTAMMSLGVLPLVDSALIPLALALPLIVILIRGTLRETIIALVGVWLLGAEFDLAFVDVWSIDNAAVQHTAVLAYLTIPRLVFLGLTLFANICSIIVYHNVKVTLVDSSRTIWRLLIALEVMLVAMLLLMPSASPAVVATLVLVMTLMMPQLFIRVDVYAASVLYLIWIVSALATIL